MHPQTETQPATEAKPCKCGSDAIEPEILKPGMPGHGTHYARLVCCDCQRFNGWMRDPRVTAAADERGTRIAALLAGAELSAWERSFLQSIARQRHLTDKQNDCWQKIQSKYSPAS